MSHIYIMNINFCIIGIITMFTGIIAVIYNGVMYHSCTSLGQHGVLQQKCNVQSPRSVTHVVCPSSDHHPQLCSNVRPRAPCCCASAPPGTTICYRTPTSSGLCGKHPCSYVYPLTHHSGGERPPSILSSPTQLSSDSITWDAVCLSFQSSLFPFATQIYPGGKHTEFELFFRLRKSNFAYVLINSPAVMCISKTYQQQPKLLLLRQ